MTTLTYDQAYLLARVANAMLDTGMVKMETWYGNRVQGNLPGPYEEPDVDLEDVGCGTTGCICGWAVALHGRDLGHKKFRETFEHLGVSEFGQAGRRLLGFSDSDAIPFSLFNYAGWPEDFARSYAAARDGEERARATVDMIRWWVRQHGGYDLDALMATARAEEEVLTMDALPSEELILLEEMFS
jgi:hypothetical protein